VGALHSLHPKVGWAALAGKLTVGVIAIIEASGHPLSPLWAALAALIVSLVHDVTGYSVPGTGTPSAPDQPDQPAVGFPTIPAIPQMPQVGSGTAAEAPASEAPLPQTGGWIRPSGVQPSEPTGTPPAAAPPEVPGPRAGQSDMPEMPPVPDMPRMPSE
jgi:hypothetical protein